MDVSLVVPAYNEEDEIVELLKHLSKINVFKEIVIVDDGSIDRTAELAIDQLQVLDSSIKFVSLSENTDKVGAIATGVGLCSSENIVLTDADTRIKNPEYVFEMVEKLNKEELDGMAFQVIPQNDSSIFTDVWSLLQDLDYTVGRIAHHFTTGERLRLNPDNKHVRCVPGAGGLYKKEILLKALEKHSGKHAGDDMETTAIAQFVDGSNIGYSSKLKFNSKAPGSYSKLLSQRLRWNKGALQSFNQQKRSYLKEMISFSRYGIVSIYEILLSVLIPFITIFLVLSIVSQNFFQFLNILTSIYTFELGLTSLVSLYSFKIGDIGRKRSLWLIPLLPFYRIAVFYPAKILSIKEFLTEKILVYIGWKKEELGVEIPEMKIYGGMETAGVVREQKIGESQRNNARKAKIKR